MTQPNGEMVTVQLPREDAQRIKDTMDKLSHAIGDGGDLTDLKGSFANLGDALSQALGAAGGAQQGGSNRGQSQGRQKP
jgi:hypothetical protein